jgi:hypothetical protein
LLEPELVHASLTALVALATADQQRPASVVDIGLVERERLADPQSASPQHGDQPADTQTWRSRPAWRITTMISSGRGGSGGYCIPLFRGARLARWPAMVAGERRLPAASRRTVCAAMTCSLLRIRPGQSRTCQCESSISRTPFTPSTLTSALGAGAESSLDPHPQTSAERSSFVDPAARRPWPSTSALSRPLAATVQAPRRGFGEEREP